VKTPPSDLATRLLDVSEQVLQAEPPQRLEDVANAVGASRATLYYYFSGREDLLTFLLTAHAREGGAAGRAAVDELGPGRASRARLQAMLTGLLVYLARRPGVCAGLLTALGAGGRMVEVLQVNDAWVAAPLRELLAEGAAAGDLDVPAPADAANAMIGALLMSVLGRAYAPGVEGFDSASQERLVEQLVRGVVTSTPR
jgi:TetR/AcrR family transcriptional regulator